MSLHLYFYKLVQIRVPFEAYLCYFISIHCIKIVFCCFITAFCIFQFCFVAFKTDKYFIEISGIQNYSITAIAIKVSYLCSDKIHCPAITVESKCIKGVLILSFPLSLHLEHFDYKCAVKSAGLLQWKYSTCG